METQTYNPQSIVGQTGTQTYNNYPASNVTNNSPARPHTCHCAADAPCRVSGRCTCMNSLLTKLEGARKNDR